MKINTKFNVGEAVLVGKKVMAIKSIKIHVGLTYPRFDDKETNTRYFCTTPDAKGHADISESVITRKATNKEWVKAGGSLKEE